MMLHDEDAKDLLKVSLITMCCFLVAALFIYAAASPASGHDHNRPDLDDWYKSLSSRKGPCCGGPQVDAHQLEELDWTREGDHYRVYIEKQWVDVPEEAVVHQPNKSGRALVWYFHMQGEPMVRCFMPGMEM